MKDLSSEPKKERSRESQEDWLAKLHYDFIERVTDTEVPLWMAETYGKLISDEPNETLTNDDNP